MIKSDQQYNISTKILDAVIEKIAKKKSGTEHNDSKKELILISPEDFKDGLEKELTACESLKNGKSGKPKESSIREGHYNKLCGGPQNG